LDCTSHNLQRFEIASPSVITWFIFIIWFLC
jgi:hypothetical protein